MAIAFVLWGGGSLGAAQVGMLRALTADGIRPDFVVGSSTGALNGVSYAACPDERGVKELADHWMRASQHDVFPLNLSQSLSVLLSNLPRHPLRGIGQALGAANHVFPLNPLNLVAAMLGQRNYLIDSERLESFLHEVLPVAHLEDTELPVEVITTELRTSQSVPLSHGHAVRAVMASSAIPGLYPAIDYDGYTLIDGEIANGTSLDRAVELGADEIYLLAPSVAAQLSETPTGVLGMTLQAYNMLVEQRLAASVKRARGQVRLHQLPTPRGANVLPIDLASTSNLIEQAAEETGEWLSSLNMAESTVSTE